MMRFIRLGYHLLKQANIILGGL